MSDPVKHCELYKDEGCVHADCYLCEHPNCSMLIAYQQLKESKEKVMQFTHVRKTYQAICLQWNDDNTEEVIKLIESTGSDVSVYGECLMIRWAEPLSHKYHIETFDKGEWVRKGENSAIKLMKDSEFQLKYEEISNV